MAQVCLGPVAVLAAVIIAGEEECVGDLAAESAGNVDESNQSYYCRFRQYEARAPDQVALLRLHYLGFPLYHQTQGPANRNHRQGLEGCVQRQTAHTGLPASQANAID